MANDSNKTFKDLGELKTVRITFDGEHLEEVDFVDFSADAMPAERKLGAIRHLDACERCREVLAELHRDSEPGPKADPLIGQLLGEYRVEEALSRGGMGVVYRGVQPMIGKKVAIKVLLPEASEDPEQMRRLLEEARVVNAIRHPNIIDIFSFGTLPDGKYYFVMELLDGRPLNELVIERGRFSPGEVLTVLDQAMAALSASHEAGVIHRDLKLANLFVSTLPDKTWHVTVLDFGLAKQQGKTSNTSPDLVVGTPGFMAPEQIRGQTLTPKADVYAMGCVAWVLLTGAESFEADSVIELMAMHVERPLPPLLESAPDCPPPVAALIEHLLAKRPEDRPTALEVLRSIARVRKDLGGAQTMKLGPVKSAPGQALRTVPARKKVKPATPTTTPDRPAVSPSDPDVTPKESASVRRNSPLVVVLTALIVITLGVAFWWWRH